RHTRFSRDWSSDVCSSDLVGAYRDTDVDPTGLFSTYLGDFAQHSLMQHIALGPLAPDEAAALLDRLVEEDSRKERILQRAGGVRSEERRVGKESRGGVKR